MVAARTGRVVLRESSILALAKRGLVWVGKKDEKLAFEPMEAERKSA